MATINKNIENIYPLSPLQEGMLFHSLLNQNSAAYLLQDLINLNFTPDEKVMKAALDLLSSKYDVLRTMIVYENLKQPRQLLLRRREMGLTFIDVSNYNADRKNTEICKAVDDDLERGFDLKNDPLLRLTFIKKGADNYTLIWTMHHIIVDGWCTKIIFDKLIEYYNRLVSGENVECITKEIQDEKNLSSSYSDYISWLVKQDELKASRY